MTITDRRPVTNDLVDTLAAWLEVPVGYGTSPVPVPTDADFPYAIVYPLAGAQTWGPPLHSPDASVDLPYQITSVGLRLDSAEHLADRVRQLLLARSPLTGAFLTPLPLPSLPGFTVSSRELSTSGGFDREGSVYSVPEVYILRINPVSA